MADVREKVEQIRQAVYGKEVRESIASGIEAINTEVESTTQRQTTLETDMAAAKRDAEEAATRANTAAGDAEDITEALAVWEDYDSDADYIPMNKVIYQGSCYINIVACKGVLPTNQTNWLKIASKGDQGIPGPMPNIVVGNTTTLLPGNSASVVRRAGSPDSAPILDFEIPRGRDGQGTGDMVKADYDSNNDGTVDAADIAGTVLDNAITDAKLSNAAGQIKARFTSHLAEFASLFPDNAGAHNSIFRGKNLGSTPDYTNITNGSFKDMYIGDYWTINGINWRIAAFNYYRNTGDSNAPGNHVVIVPDTSLYSHVMNASNTTEGGYTGSKMYTEGLGQAKTIINNAFPGHVVTIRAYLCNAVTNGKASAGAWVDSTVDLMNEVMVYGSVVNGAATYGLYNIGTEKSQLPLFALNPQSINTRYSYWLRDVASASDFASVGNSGFAGRHGASSSHAVRPRFLIS
jgi:hypothetical protein